MMWIRTSSAALAAVALLCGASACGDDDDSSADAADACGLIRKADIEELVAEPLTKTSPGADSGRDIRRCVWEINGQSGATLEVRPADGKLFASQTASGFKDADVDGAQARYRLATQPSKGTRSGTIYALTDGYMVTFQVSASKLEEAELVRGLESAVEDVLKKVD